MSTIPLLNNESDEEDSRCVRKRNRHESEIKVCCWFFYRIFSNDKDMSFTPAEIQFFDKNAHSYNLANFMEGKINQTPAVSNCLTKYFLANFAIVQGKLKEGEKHVREGLQIARLSQKHDLYSLLLASPFARVFHMKDNINGLHSLLDGCFQQIETLGRGGVPGSILGWLYYTRARALKNDKAAAIADFELAIDAFNLSETIDKDFGVAHTLCRLIICRLGCGERADTIDEIETPFPEEMRRVKSHFKHLEDMEIVNQCLVVRIIFLMAESDYYCRIRKPNLSLERAREAHQITINSKCNEFRETTEQRLRVYSNKCKEMSGVDGTQPSENQLPSVNDN